MTWNLLDRNSQLLPILVLVALLSYNVWVYGDDALSGSNQFILLIGGAFAAVIGFVKKISYNRMIQKVAENLQSVTGALLILLFVVPVVMHFQLLPMSFFKTINN